MGQELKDTAVKNAKPGHPPRKPYTGEPYKMTDGDGLYLYVSPVSERNPKGAKSWRYDYRLGPKRETLTIGKYPDVSLSEAREEHGKARKLVAKGESPARAKQQRIEQRRIAHQNTVKAVCEKWYDSKAHARSPSWQDNIRRWLDQDVYPEHGSTPIKDLTDEDIESLIRKVAKTRGANSAHNVRLMLAGVYKSLPRNLKLGNPARDAAGVIEVPKGQPKGKPLPAKHIPALIETIEKAAARKQTKLAARLLLLTFTRKVELIAAPWEELDLQAGEWTIPAERMKASRPHIVPLSRQAVLCFEYLKPLSAGSRFVFPNLGNQNKPMAGTTMNKFFHSIGYPHFTPHSARSTASTILNGQGFSGDAIELQLAHVERDPTRAAYNYADKMEERRKMMQTWADYIDALCAGSNVVAMQRGKAAA